MKKQEASNRVGPQNPLCRQDGFGNIVCEVACCWNNKKLSPRHIQAYKNSWKINVICEPGVRDSEILLSIKANIPFISASLISSGIVGLGSACARSVAYTITVWGATFKCWALQRRLPPITLFFVARFRMLFGKACWLGSGVYLWLQWMWRYHYEPVFVFFLLCFCEWFRDNSDIISGQYFSHSFFGRSCDPVKISNFLRASQLTKSSICSQWLCNQIWRVLRLGL